MIFVGGLPFETDSTSQGSDNLLALLEHPALVSASLSFKAIPEKKYYNSEVSSLDGSTKARHVYLFQREYATVDPAFVDLIGTDEATTCVGLVIRNRVNGMTSVAHMDSPCVVDIGLSQLLSKLVDHKIDSELDVHLIGGFDDAPKPANRSTTRSQSEKKQDGYSFPLCVKVIEALKKSKEKFHLQTLFVLGHNTRQDSEGNALPIFNGFVVETSSGAITPASFDNTTRCPDEQVRRVRVSASFKDPRWSDKLLETYYTETDQVVIAPCSWSLRMVHMAFALEDLPDSEILRTCSTSPCAEAPDFVENQRRQWEYLIQHPNWKETFQMGRPRRFRRTEGGEWTMVE